MKKLNRTDWTRKGSPYFASREESHLTSNGWAESVSEYCLYSNVQPGEVVSDGYSGKHVNRSDVPRSFWEVAYGNEHARFEWRADVP